jgi:hypothetical protein
LGTDDLYGDRTDTDRDSLIIKRTEARENTFRQPLSTLETAKEQKVKMSVIVNFVPTILPSEAGSVMVKKTSAKHEYVARDEQATPRRFGIELATFDKINSSPILRGT